MRRKGYANRLCAFLMSVCMVVPSLFTGVNAYAIESMDDTQIVSETEVSTEDTTEVLSTEVSTETEISTVATTEEELTTAEETTTAAITEEETTTEEVELEVVESFIVEGGVLKLADGASISESMTIPASCTVIPKGIFNGSTAIKSITIEGTGTIEIQKDAFLGCSSLGSITCTGKTITVGESAFSSCKSLSLFPFDKLVTIGDYAFSDTGILKIDKIASVNSIGTGAFSSSKVQTVNLGTISPSFYGEKIFKDCKGLTNITTPASMTTIPKSTFEGCSALKSVTISEGTTTIDTNAFKDCTALEKVSIAATVDRIEAYAFAGCSKLKEIAILYPQAGESIYIDDDAFPILTGGGQNVVVVRGYNDLVQKYVERMKYVLGGSYRFESLNDKYKVEYTGAGSGGTVQLFYYEGHKNGAEIANKANVAPGRMVRVLITPNYAGGYGIMGKGEGFTIKEDGTLKDVTYNVNADYYGTISLDFVMPSRPVTIETNFKKWDPYKNYRVDIAGGSHYTYDPATKKLAFDVDGCESAPLEIYATNNKTNIEELLPYWMFSFNKTYEYIDMNLSGQIRGIRTGSGKITGCLRTTGNAAFAINVSVGPRGVVEAIDFDFNFEGSTYPSYAKAPYVDAGGDWVIEIPKSKVREEFIEFDILAKFYGESDFRKVSLMTVWGSSNYSNIYVGALYGYSRRKFHIYPSITGDTRVICKIVNPANNIKGAKAEVFRYIVVRIIDDTPKLNTTDIKINYDSTVGSPFTVIPVNNTEIYYEGGLTAWTRTSKGSMNVYNQLGDVNIKYDATGKKYYMIATDQCNVAAGTSKVYSGDGKIYLRGYYKNSDGTKGDRFEIPVSKVTITRPKVGTGITTTAKLSGKINVFYAASNSNSGSVTATLTNINEELESAFLMTNNTATELDADDPLYKNFKVNVVSGNSTKVTITRTANTLETDVKNRPIVQGYMYLKYKGIDYYVKSNKITIGYTNKGPSYALSETSGQVYSKVYDMDFTVQLKDKTTKKVVDLTSADEITVDSSNYRVSFDPDTDNITIGTNGAPVAGKIGVLVKKADWNGPVKYVFTLKTIKTLPTVKANKTSVTMNKNFGSETDTITFTTPKRYDVALEGFDVAFAGSVKLEEEANKLSVTVSDDDAITVKMLDDSVKKGTYAYKVYPIVSYESAEGTTDEKYTKPITIKVVVTEAMPGIKLAKTNGSLNAYCPGDEELIVNYTFTNLPVGKTYSVKTEPTIEPKKATDTVAEDVLKYLSFDFSTPGQIKIRLASTYAKRGAFGCALKFSDMTIQSNDGSSVVDIPAFTYTVKGNANSPKITIKGTGKINTISPSSGITYTTKISNIVTSINDISVYEYNDKGERLTTVSDRLTVTDLSDDGDWSKFILQSVDGKEYPSRIYYAFAYTLVDDPTGEVYYTNKLSAVLTPNTYPTISVKSQNRGYVYAAEKYDTRYVEVLVETTKVTDAKMIGATISKTKNDENTLMAFNIAGVEQVSDNQYIVKLRVMSPSRLISGATYKVYIEPVYENQMKNTTATGFTGSVAIRY